MVVVTAGTTVGITVVTTGMQGITATGPIGTRATTPTITRTGPTTIVPFPVIGMGIIPTPGAVVGDGAILGKPRIG